MCSHISVQTLDNDSTHAPTWGAESFARVMSRPPFFRRVSTDALLALTGKRADVTTVELCVESSSCAPAQMSNSTAIGCGRRGSHCRGDSMLSNEQIAYGGRQFVARFRVLDVAVENTSSQPSLMFPAKVMILERMNLLSAHVHFGTAI